MGSTNRYTKLIAALEALLLIPLVANFTTNEVNWSTSDFLSMAVLLFVLASAIELVLRKIHNKRNRIVLIVIVALIFLFIWAELAVGIIGSPFAGS